MFLHILVETAFGIISIQGMKGTAAFWMRYSLKKVSNSHSLFEGTPALVQRMVGLSLPLAEHWMVILLSSSRH